MSAPERFYSTAEKEFNEKFQPRCALWRELIEGSGAPDKEREQFLKILKNIKEAHPNMYGGPGNWRDLLYGALSQWSDVLHKKSPDIFRYDAEFSRQKQYGQIPSIKLSTEDQVLHNLYDALREDVNRFMIEI